MSALQDHTPPLRFKRHIHGAYVIASWSITAAWITLEVLLPPHRTEAILWRAGIALGLAAASSSLLIIWYLLGALIEPVNNERAAFRIGYRAGYTDGVENREPCKVWLLPSPRNENHARANTDRTG